MGAAHLKSSVLERLMETTFGAPNYSNRSNSMIVQVYEDGWYLSYAQAVAAAQGL